MTVHTSILVSFLWLITPLCAQVVSLGMLRTREHLVAGEVFLLSERVLEIRNFTYDGRGPDVFFWADTSASPTEKGFYLQDGTPTKSCGINPLPSAANGKATYRVEFPAGKSIRDILGGSFSVWCKQFSANFGEVVIPRSIPGLVSTVDGPQLQCDKDESSLGQLSSLAHGVAGEVVVLSDRLIEIRGFKYDGLGPDTFFWADSSATPSSKGFVLLDAAPTNLCGSEPLPSADGFRTFRVEFPPGKSIKDIVGGSISIWCVAFRENFGHVTIPTTLVASTTDSSDLGCTSIVETPQGYNCEPLSDNLQVRWKVENQSLAIELLGRIDADTYMGFGPSGSETSTNMDASDPVVADFYQGNFRARDFYTISRGQCSNGQGVCPDVSSSGLSNDVTNVSGERDEGAGITLIRYKKPLFPKDANTSISGDLIDQSISIKAGDKTYVVWALGPISPDTGLPNFHTIDYARTDVFVEFGRSPINNCDPFVVAPAPAPIESLPFERPVLRDITSFRAVIGPNGGSKGYTAITGRVSWGIAWYINDLLIPVIELRRGTTYKFHVNGGLDPSSTSQYHPFYISTSISGGYSQLSPKERQNETVLAGITITAENATGVTAFKADAFGPLCSYEVTAATDDSLSFEQYIATLNTACSRNPSITGEAGILEFTPDESTPDTLYYHCVTHRNLGWEIKVLDKRGPVSSVFNRIRSIVRRLLGLVF